jgi:hypothetical protein
LINIFAFDWYQGVPFNAKMTPIANPASVKKVTTQRWRLKMLTISNTLSLSFTAVTATGRLLSDSLFMFIDWSRFSFLKLTHDPVQTADVNRHPIVGG